MITRKRLLIGGGASLGLVAALVIAALIVVQTPWFSDFLRGKVISSIEESTGGRVEMGSFQFDWSRLTVRIRDFVLHGTEPKNEDPLARIALLELRLKLFSGFRKMVDLTYLGVDQPRVNLIVNPDGTTNIPKPKVQSPPSPASPLQTVVDLAVSEFKIDSGTLVYSQQKAPFSARGENLRVLLNYNAANPSYSGNISIAPLVLASGSNPPLNIRVNVPIAIDKDTVRLTDARLTTSASQVLVNASLQNLNAPSISARINANLSLAEAQRTLGLSLDTAARDLPKFMTADLDATVDQSANNIQIRSAHLALGDTKFEASGNQTVQFNGNMALAQLSRLLKVAAAQIGGAIQVSGQANLDARNNFSVDGALNSRGVSLSSGTTHISNLTLHGPFHADPNLITMNGFRLDAVGGMLSAKLTIEKLQHLSLAGTLQNFSLPAMAAAFTGHSLGYDGIINGSFQGTSNLSDKGAKGLRAQARLTISPGTHGVPVAGRLEAGFNGARETIDLGNSYVTLPNSRLELSGAVNKQLQVSLVSHNLNDFLPAANFGSAKPMQTLPIMLHGGSASVTGQVNGSLAAPSVAAHASMDHFAAQGRVFDQLALDLNASSSAAAISNGTLTRRSSHTAFDGSIGLVKWQPQPVSPLKANLTLNDGDLADLLSLAGQTTPASGQVAADVHLNGTFGNPQGSGSLQVANAVVYRQPFDHILANVNLADRLITLNNLELDSAGGKITAYGTFRHPVESFTIGHADLHLRTNSLQLANVQALREKSPGIAGGIGLTADAAADVIKQGEVKVTNINADLSALGLRVRNQNAGNLTASARTVNGNVNYTLTSDFAGADVKANGRTALTNDYATQASAAVRNLPIEKALQIIGRGDIPARGQLNADAKFSGTSSTPDVDSDFTLSKANLYQEPVNQLHAHLHYTDTQLDLPVLDLVIPAGSLNAVGNYTHVKGDFDNGNLQLRLKSSDIDLARIEHARQEQLGFAGTLRLAADAAAAVKDQDGKPVLLLSNVNADASASSLRMNGSDLGQLSFSAQTKHSQLSFKLDTDLAQSQIHAAGESQLAGKYPTRASLTFANIRYANLAPFIPSDAAVKPPYDALLEGQASLNGPALSPDEMTGRMQVNHLDVHTIPRSTAGGGPGIRSVAFQNDGPLIVALDHSVLRVEQFKLQGPKTSIVASGALDLKNSSSPFALKVNANADLAVLQDMDRAFYSSGSVLVDATLRGNASKPLVNGRIELKNASVNYASSPNGLSHGNGVILLNGTSANIENLTGESGGGKIAVSGFVGFGPSALIYNLDAKATKVRTRYSGASIVSSANISLTGNTRRSLLGGTVTIHRIAYSASSDAGSLLSSASVPPSTKTAPSPLLAGMRLDVRIVTAPDLRVVSSYTDKLDVTSSLTVRGTAANPGVLGRLNITNGQLEFFGNTYNVNTGSISFYNPNDIQPIVDFSLETIAQGVAVNLGISGPVNDLKLSYRSDPPLSFEQIVQLLATNTTPSDPTIAAHQPSPAQQSVGQMGESAVLGQAVANPLASRVKRVFGLTQFKVDPSFSGSNGQPSARVTLQEKVASNLTFTYITDVTQTNSEIVRVQLDLSPRVSAVALRDYNGNVSVEFFYKFQVR